LRAEYASSSQPTVHLTGAGSTFDAPFFAAAFGKYHEIHLNVSVSYAAVGSSKGIARFSADTVNFGASDVPMTAAEQSAAVGGAVIQVLVDLGAVVVSYHVPSIGYFELSYAETQFLPYVLIEHAAGSFVLPFPANVAADAAMKPNISALDFSIVDEPGSASYPISGYSWMLLYERQKSARIAAALVALATWMTHAGQDEAATHLYVSHPQKVRNLARNTLERMVGPLH